MAYLVILICYDSMSMFSNALSLYITPQAAVPYQMTIIVINIVNTLVLQPAVYVSRETYSTLSSLYNRFYTSLYFGVRRLCVQTSLNKPFFKALSKTNKGFFGI